MSSTGHVHKCAPLRTVRAGDPDTGSVCVGAVSPKPFSTHSKETGSEVGGRTFIVPLPPSLRRGSPSPVGGPHLLPLTLLKDTSPVCRPVFPIRPQELLWARQGRQPLEVVSRSTYPAPTRVHTGSAAATFVYFSGPGTPLKCPAKH